MSARDELARTIRFNLMSYVSDFQAREVAKALVAAGYRKPRKVTTLAEVEALPLESVVRSHFGVTYEKDRDEAGCEFWTCIGFEDKNTPDEVSLPATVLYTPKES